MKTLTATNQRVQFYLTYATEWPSTALKRDRMRLLEANLNDRGIMLDELFPNKQAAVLDHILYITSAAGISKVGGAKLAERCDVSVRTVMSAIKALKSTGEFIVARLIKTGGGAGKYIFVDKKHPNFREVMREVFSLSDYKIAELIAEPIACQNSEQSLEAVGVESDNGSSNSNSSFIFKTCSSNNMYLTNEPDREAIKTSIDLEQPVDLDEQRERLQEYATNEYQTILFDFLRSMPKLAPEVSDNLYKIALAIGSDATVRHFHVAKSAALDISMQLLTGKTRVKTSVRALFEEMYQARLEALTEAPGHPTDTFTKHNEYVPRPELFYNWLEERE